MTTTGERASTHTAARLLNDVREATGTAGVRPLAAADLRPEYRLLIERPGLQGPGALDRTAREALAPLRRLREEQRAYARRAPRDRYAHATTHDLPNESETR